MADDSQQPAERAAGPKLPAIAAKKELDELELRLGRRNGTEDLARRSGGERGEQLQKYQYDLEAKLSEEAQGQLPRANAAGGFGGIAAGGGQLSAPAAAGFGAMAGVNAAAPRTEGEQIAQVAAGLASLDVRLPERGKMYLFTTPRGDIEITASAVSASTLSRLSGLAAVLFAIFLVWLLSRESSRRVWRRLGESTAVGIAIVILGLACLILGVFPFASLLVIIIGLFIVIRSRLTPSLAAAI